MPPDRRNPPLSPGRGSGPERSPVGNDGYRGFMGRILRAYGRRIGAGDVAALPELVALEDELAATIESAIRQLRHEPWNYSWAEIARVLGVSRQAAMKRWGHVGGSRHAGGQPSNLR